MFQIVRFEEEIEQIILQVLSEAGWRFDNFDINIKVNSLPILVRELCSFGFVRIVADVLLNGEVFASMCGKCFLFDDRVTFEIRYTAFACNPEEVCGNHEIFEYHDNQVKKINESIIFNKKVRRNVFSLYQTRFGPICETYNSGTFWS